MSSDVTVKWLVKLLQHKVVHAGSRTTDATKLIALVKTSHARACVRCRQY